MKSFFYIVAKLLGIILFKIFFNWEVKGKKYIPRKDGFIIASNHLSYLDPPVIGVASPRKLRYLAKSSLFKTPVLSFLIKIYGAIPIEREKEYSISIRKGLEILKNGEGLVIFPEGTRNPKGEVKIPKKGVAFLAYKTGVPVIPVKIKGTEKALSVGGKFIKPAKVKVVFGPPVKVESNNYLNQANRIMNLIKELK